MLKFIKLRKLDKKRKAHVEAATFCYRKQEEMLRNKESLTEKGKERWRSYASRFNVHIDAYKRLTKKKYGALIHSN